MITIVKQSLILSGPAFWTPPLLAIQSNRQSPISPSVRSKLSSGFPESVSDGSWSPAQLTEAPQAQGVTAFSLLMSLCYTKPPFPSPLCLRLCAWSKQRERGTAEERGKSRKPDVPSLSRITDHVPLRPWLGIIFTGLLFLRSSCLPS